MRNNPTMHRADGVALKDYVDTRFEAVCKEIAKAESALNTRLESMNEFRDQLKDQAARFVTREEVNLMLQPISEDVRELRSFVNRHEGMASQKSVSVAIAIAVISLLLGVLRMFMK